jgi:hypothetical protein
MRRGALRIGAELVSVLAVLASLAGAWGLVVAMHRRQAAERRAAVVVVSPPAPKPRPKPALRPRPASAPAAPVEDPTPKELARLAALEDEERREANEAASRSAAIEEQARQAEARAAANRSRQGELLGQIDELEHQVGRVEGHLETLARQRDVLARTRDDARVELALARSRDGLAVLPYKGPNGTWRRPIPIECRDGQATIQPGGPTFGMVDLAGLAMFRANPLVAAVGRYLDHAERGRSPDGAPVVPYILFIVRPDGIRPYYEARSLLEPLGISFGYELVEQDTELDFPDLDDPIEWSESPPPRFARGGWPPPAGAGAAKGDDPFIWPTVPPGVGSVSGLGMSGEPGLSEGGLLLPGDLDPGGAGRDLEGAGEGSAPPRDRFPSGGGGLARGDTSIDDDAPAGASRWSRRPGSLPPGELGTEPRTGGAPRPGGAWGGGSVTAADRADSDAPAAGGRRDVPDGVGPDPLRSAHATSPGTARPGGAPGSGTAGASGAGAGDGSTFRMERPLDLVVACGPSGVVIQPGGYRLSAPNLEPKDAKLVETLRGLVERREAREPANVMVKPRVTFLVEPGGQTTYWKARQQTVLAGLGWPVRLRVAEGSVSSAIGQGGWLR